MTIALTLCDRSPEIVRAWRQIFPLDAGVTVANQNLLTQKVNAIVVPANSFGYTDGGVDIAISREIFDWKLQEKLRKLIDQRFAGELIVGQAVILPTESNHFRYVVVAPTMRIPADVSQTINAYLAMRAVLLTIAAHNREAQTDAERIRSVAVPGLCTGTGKMSPERAAYQMFCAYKSLVLGDLEWTKSLDKQIEHDRQMRNR